MSTLRLEHARLCQLWNRRRHERFHYRLTRKPQADPGWAHWPGISLLSPIQNKPPASAVTWRLPGAYFRTQCF